MRRAMMWRTLGLAVTLSISLPAVAAAAPIDTASDHVALRAYGNYAQGVLSRLPAARSADEAYIASIAKTCPDVLAAANLLPQDAINQGSAVAFGEELAGDLVVAAYRPDRAPFATLAATLTRLRWSSQQTAGTIKAFLTGQRKEFRVGPSHLCADARALAASNVRRTPRGTLRWLARFGRVASAEQTHLGAFLRVLGQFQAPDDAAQIATDNRLVRKVMVALPTLITSEADKLGSALGLSL